MLNRLRIDRTTAAESASFWRHDSDRDTAEADGLALDAPRMGAQQAEAPRAADPEAAEETPPTAASRRYHPDRAGETSLRLARPADGTGCDLASRRTYRRHRS